MHSLCFMIPVITFSRSADTFVVSVVWFASPGNFRMSLSFRVVVVPVVRFLRRYDGVSNPWCFLWLCTIAGIFHCPSWSLKYTLSPVLNTSGLRRPLFNRFVCFILLPSLSFLVSELSIILWGIVGNPGNLPGLLRNNSAGDPVLSGLCSQLMMWHASAMPC